MNSYLVKTPKFVQRLFPKRIWALPNESNSVYLTFDDGPIPEVTPWVIDTLKQYNAKATFFCIGDNVVKHPKVFNQLLEEGHAIGNHTFNHLNGWKTETEIYLSNCNLLNESEKLFSGTKLFRPPFGRLTFSQSKNLQKEGYHIIMWDVLSADFDKSISKEKCLENVLKNIEVGSIVVFHDSLKSNEKLRYILPKVLEHIKSNKWKCAKIKLN